MNHMMRLRCGFLATMTAALITACGGAAAPSEDDRTQGRSGLDAPVEASPLVPDYQGDPGDLLTLTNFGTSEHILVYDYQRLLQQALDE